jgi:hypothetical protein
MAAQYLLEFAHPRMVSITWPSGLRIMGRSGISYSKPGTRNAFGSW